MPGEDALYSEAPSLYPGDEEEYAKLVGWCSQAWFAANSASEENRRRWRRYNRLYRSYLKRDMRSWRSQLFIPYTFSFIESITPKILAEPPKPVCMPVAEDDVFAAKVMESLLDRSVVETKLQIELIKAGKSALKYGTGILKTYWKQDIRRAWERVPVMQPVMEEQPVTDGQGQAMVSPDGGPVMSQVQTQQMEPVMGPDGQPQMEVKPYEYIAYEGPSAEWVDIFKFYVAPEAMDIQDARYVIQQKYVDAEDIARKIAEGMYQLPPGVESVKQLVSSHYNDPAEERRGEVEEDSIDNDATAKPIELWEFWLKDGRLITVANQRHLLRVQAFPFWHGEKPFVRMVDYIQEGEFWGIGEIEAIEGLQDVQNAIWNQRIDNVRLAMDKPKAVHVDAIADERDLTSRPGQTIRITGDRHPSEALYFWDTPEVTGSAYAEAEQIESMMERVTGASAYTVGQDSDHLNRTATGVALLTEAGNTKFAHKVLIMEMLTLQDLFRQWGGLIQQFTDQPKTIRMLGPAGQVLFPTLTPDAVQGSLDYQIVARSTTQTETVRKEQAMTRMQTIASVWPVAIPKLVMDMLEAEGVKDFTPYLFGVPDLQMFVAQQQAMMQMQGMAGGGEEQQQQQEPVSQGGQGESATGP